MKRDLDLVRSILIYVEKADDQVDVAEMVTDRWSREMVEYHVRLMAHHGLLDLSQDFRESFGAVSN